MVELALVDRELQAAGKTGDPENERSEGPDGSSDG